MEQTILDSINDFEKIAGLEEVLQCIELIPYVDEKKLLQYLNLYNKQILYQKTGYILSHFKDVLRLSDRFFEKCVLSIGHSIRYLCNGLASAEKNTVIFDKHWQLFVPQTLMLNVKNYGYNKTKKTC
jgi:predicted transcriptional regulator of viral defense system